jgi:hypothetical protein
VTDKKPSIKKERNGILQYRIYLKVLRTSVTNFLFVTKNVITAVGPILLTMVVQKYKKPWKRDQYCVAPYRLHRNKTEHHTGAPHPPALSPCFSINPTDCRNSRFSSEAVGPLLGVSGARLVPEPPASTAWWMVVRVGALLRGRAAGDSNRLSFLSQQALFYYVEEGMGFCAVLQ